MPTRTAFLCHVQVLGTSTADVVKNSLGLACEPRAGEDNFGSLNTSKPQEFSERASNSSKNCILVEIFASSPVPCVDLATGSSVVEGLNVTAVQQLDRCGARLTNMIVHSFGMVNFKLFQGALLHFVAYPFVLASGGCVLCVALQTAGGLVA